METVTVDIASAALLSALENVLHQRGYRAFRNFDLRLDGSRNAVTVGVAAPCDCECDFTVLQVFRKWPVSSGSSGGNWVGSISVRGLGASSTVSLAAPDGDGDLVAQFASMIVAVIDATEIRRSGN